ncbi:MAG: flagellar biosynthesis regulator FlaF [Acidibrevibacterium sp.]|jgi:flagellar protein FlaF|uniref:flagellar biosynthesis regulator FlaF n=1 Tax=Acidibrevibacterium fodinaquatile TaxID=1969806 RepID=UPI0023A85D6A|nr:flagellar biosynthesis regulator FlaF [Acidibrevibacterium fodinaquatile]MCA7120315.1 flagellar biosynthesis regulator FlaF [Acidibrevibacterium fodinaquatile]
MNRNLAQYETARRFTATPQDNEILIFSNANAMLANAKTADAKTRISALFHNQRLWSAIVKDLALETNQLPAELKQNLTDLGIWAMQYSTRAMGEDLSLDPLIAVNRDMIEGLQAQRAAAPPPLPTRGDLASAGLVQSAV